MPKSTVKQAIVEDSPPKFGGLSLHPHDFVEYGFSERGVLWENVFFRRVYFLEIPGNLEALEIPENPQTAKNKENPTTSYRTIEGETCMRQLPDFGAGATSFF